MTDIPTGFCMTPMIIQEGSFSGAILYENKHFVSPNLVRADLRRRKATKHTARQEHRMERDAKKDALGIQTGGKAAPRDALDSREVFA